MKRLALLVAVYLLMPGSGQLVWDGLPLSTRTEFITLVLVVIAFTNREFRSRVQSKLKKSRLRGAVLPGLALLSVLKLLSFAWYPFSDGFDSCYRSTYYPLENPQACEKSYEGPFLLRSDLGFDNTSRIDKTIDFGVHKHDWSLPFMNEYPRLSALWLERFPFTATFGAVIKNESSQPEFLPIYGNGEIEGTVGESPFGTSDIPMSDRYEFPRLTLLKVPSGASEFTLRYRYADDESASPPSEAPAPRGPYALLKVGDLKSRDALLDIARVRIRGWAVDIAGARTPDHIVALDSSGNELGRGEPQERPDVAQFVGQPSLTKNGFNFTIPANSLSSGEVTIAADFGGEKISVASLQAPESYLPELPEINLSTGPTLRGDLTVWFDVDRRDFKALAPESRFETPFRLDALLALLDAASAAIFLVMLGGAFIAIRKDLLVAVALAIAAFGLVQAGPKLLPDAVGSPLLFPIVALTLLVVWVIRSVRPTSLLTFLPTAVVLAAYKSFDHLERFHSSQGERWWGRLLYYWRDSDWYATQGYARTVFLERSLRGGEALFWFQAGPRYLAFVTRSLLGEQDALIGIIMVSLGFFSVLVLAARFLGKSDHRFTWLVGGCSLFATLYFMSDDLMAGFGFVGSSEYPTWIVLFVAAGFIILTKTEARAWPMVAFAVALGYSIQLRPNQIGGVVLMFVVMLLLVDRSDVTRAIGTISKMVASFAAVVLFSLCHNLYYGESFVPFTANAGINYQFSWLDVLGFNPGEDDRLGTWGTVASQLRFMMYWNAPGNLSWASLFWGAQLLWIVTIAYRYKKGLLFKVKSLLLLIPFGYALPMLKYQMTSYYPRHLVAINLAFLLTALMAWPHSEDSNCEERKKEPELAPSSLSDAGALNAPSR